MAETTWLDRTVQTLAPQWYLKRMRAKLAADLVQRHYEAATIGRRTQGWNRTISDANAASGPSLGRLRDAARDLVRNNPYASSALDTIVDHTIGWGLAASVDHPEFKRWAESTAIDADGRHNLAGLEKLVMRTVVCDGEVLVRRRFRRPDDGFTFPLQLQVLEADFLDTAKDQALPTGGRIIQGVEFDPIGRRVAYWLFKEHPGASLTSSRIFGSSVRVPAEEIVHVFKSLRPGQVRGVSWYASILLRFKDFDEFEDATLMKQKIAACLAVITSDMDGTAPPLGTNDSTVNPEIDTLSPGMILNVAPGRKIDVVSPPTVREYADYCKTSLRAIATGIGVTYEDLTGDYENLPFSAARMSRLRHMARVEDWRWRIVVPQFLAPVWGWAGQVAALLGAPMPVSTEWTAPPLPMVDPEKEGLSIMRNVRAGITTFSEEIRARGYNVTQFLDELQKDFEELDRRGLVLDSDPRKMTQAGQLQQAATAPPASTAAAADDEDAERRYPRAARR